MAINFVYGVPRSGKTYYCVNHLLKKYFVFDKGLGEYVRKKEFENVKIISNIAGLKLEHQDLMEWVKYAGGIDKFFSYDSQEKIYLKHGPVVYLIDEAHMYFPSDYKCKEVINWFTYHAHWGQTIYIMSQAFSLLPRRLTDLVDLCRYALPPSSTLLAGRDLKYNVIAGREFVDKETLIKNKKVFAVYKSQEANEVERAKNPMMKYVIGIGLIVLFIGWKGYTFVSSFGHGSEQLAVERSLRESSPGSATAGTIPENYNSPETSSKMNQETKKTQEIQDNEEKIVVRVSKTRSARGTLLYIGNRVYQIHKFPYEVEEGPFGELWASLTPAEHKNLFPGEKIEPQKPTPAKEGQVLKRAQARPPIDASYQGQG